VRLAYADGKQHIPDPDRMVATARADDGRPGSSLLAPGYLARRRAEIDAAKATADVVAGQPLAGTDTVSFQVVDGEGNGVSMVNSLSSAWGTGIVPEGVGFALQVTAARARSHGLSAHMAQGRGCIVVAAATAMHLGGRTTMPAAPWWPRHARGRIVAATAPCCQQPRRRRAEPGRRLLARPGPPERHRWRQAPVPHHHPGAPRAQFSSASEPSAVTESSGEFV
jgi:hypothetical protein